MSTNTDKYSRSVSMICPTCGSDQFEHGGSDDPNKVITCGGCKREFTKDELIGLNSENISEHVDEMGKELIKDFTANFRNTLKKTFRGSKHIKIK